MKALCYISNFATDLNRQTIDELITHVDENNNVNNITGILIIRNKHFFQILEGKRNQVDTLFKKIEKDERHKGVIKLLDTKIEGRIFHDYNSGNFEIFQKSTDLKKLYLYFNWIKNADYLPAEVLIQLTTNFLNQNK